MRIITIVLSTIAFVNDLEGTSPLTTGEGKAMAHPSKEVMSR